jgi:baculoviral IAP repeat-containing protein 6
LFISYISLLIEFYYYTVGGELHFLQIGGACDDIDEADILVDGSLSKGIEPSLEGSKPLSNPSSPGISGMKLNF